RSCHSFDCSAPHPDLHSFPTRRSSDLLLEVMRHGILCQERRLDLNLGADPFTLRMRCVSRVVASLPTPQASAERRTFNLVELPEDRKSTRLNSSHVAISYAVFCLKKKK